MSCRLVVARMSSNVVSTSIKGFGPFVDFEMPKDMSHQIQSPPQQRSSSQLLVQWSYPENLLCRRTSSKNLGRFRGSSPGTSDSRWKKNHPSQEVYNLTHNGDSFPWRVSLETSAILGYVLVQWIHVQPNHGHHSEAVMLFLVFLLVPARYNLWTGWFGPFAMNLESNGHIEPRNSSDLFLAPGSKDWLAIVNRALPTQVHSQRAFVPPKKGAVLIESIAPSDRILLTLLVWLKAQSTVYPKNMIRSRKEITANRNDLSESRTLHNETLWELKHSNDLNRSFEERKKN